MSPVILDFRDSVFSAVLSLMEMDANVILLTNDMGAAGVDTLKAKFPSRTVNLGVAEQNLMSVAGGLAYSGHAVFCYGIASHLVSRAYEQIRLDLCVPKLPVTLLAIGSGLAYGMDGPTHHAMHDVALMSTLPGMQIFNPSDGISAARAVELSYQSGSPSYIRLDKDQLPGLYIGEKARAMDAGAAILREGENTALVSGGVLLRRCLTIAEKLAVSGHRPAVVDVFRLRPLNEEFFVKLGRQCSKIMVIEEQIAFGSLGMQLSEIYSRHRMPVTLEQLNVGEGLYLGAATRAHVQPKNGLSESQLLQKVEAFCR